ncbi:MAG: ABC transporter substrate-binding protein, partial [Pseudomonadota bacterium]
MRSILKASVAALGLVAATATGAIAGSHSNLEGTLRIISDMSNPAPRAVMEGMAAEFDAMHPSLTVELEIVDREAWKTQIRNALTANAPDVVNWYAANRMLPYVNAGLFMDITDMYDNGDLPGLDAVRGALTIDGKAYGVPYTYYQWGIYYREDIFNELGLEEPATFEQELANCEKIVASGRACYAIGTKFLWTAGGWFDYLNMRTNGFDHHMALARGELSWTEDAGVRETFANWRKIIDMGGYIADHQSYSWQEALKFMTDGDATAYLIGNFAVSPMRDAGLDDSQID